MPKRSETRTCRIRSSRCRPTRVARPRVLSAGFLTFAIVAAWIAQPAVPGAATGPVAGLVGPDLIAGDIAAVSSWGTDPSVAAYSFGIDSCNIGDVPVSWSAATPAHPVLGQSIYRLENGRLEQIGLGWLFHGICALDNASCGPCTPTGCASLGIGCSSQNSSSIAGQQAFLGPRSDVDPSTGAFPFPASDPPISSIVDRRVQVKLDDIDPALHPGAAYFVESISIAADDALAGNGANNVSHRAITFGSAPAYPIAFSGATEVSSSVLAGWAAADPDVTVTPIDVPGDGGFEIGTRVTDNGDGTWHYEYAIFNRDVSRAAGAFRLPIARGVILSDIGFGDVDYHSGEPWDGTDWNVIQTPDELRWSTTSHDVDPDANALRWSTLYNFRFDANAPPTLENATLELFRPGTPDSVSVAVPVPTEAAALRIVLTPSATQVVPGERLSFDVTIDNNTGAAQSIDAWIDATKPNGNPYAGNPVLGPKSLTLNPGRVITRTASLRVPAGTPPSGPYRLTGKLGTFPTSVTSASFAFDVVAP